MSQPLVFAVIVPCFNEEQLVEHCTLSLLDVPAVDTIMLVDDGSSDNTAGVIRRLEATHMPRVVSHCMASNVGKHRAIREATSRVQADIVIVHDADLAVDRQLLEQIIECFRQQPDQLVYASRLSLPMTPGAMAPCVRWGNRFFATWVGLLVGMHVTDVLCGLKALPRQRLLNISPSRCRWGDFDLIFGAVDQSLALREVPLRFSRRQVGVSKMRYFRASLVFAGLCLQHMFATAKRSLRATMLRLGYARRP